MNECRMRVCVGEESGTSRGRGANTMRSLLLILIAAISLTTSHVVFTPINTAPAGDDSTVLQLEVEHG
jgi:hypothetical protein